MSQVWSIDECNDLCKQVTSDLVVEEFIASSVFSSIYKAKQNGHDVVLKIVSMKQLGNNGILRQMDVEIECNQRVATKNHPYILCFRTFYEIFEHKKDKPIRSHVLMIFEPFCQGDLFDLVILKFDESKLDQDDELYTNYELRIARYVRQIVESLQFCHENNVVHRDLKPENILLTKENNIQLCDFGLSACQKESIQGHYGTIDFLAPEVVSNTIYDFRIDNWSLGVLVYELLTGLLPFGSPEANEQTIYENIKNGNFEFPDKPNLSTAAKSFVTSLLQLQPSKRMSLKQALSHEFLTRVSQN